MKKKKKYQEGGTEAAPFSVDNQIIDYTDFLSPDSMDMLNYYQNGGMERQSANGGEMAGDAVMPFTSFNGDMHTDPSRGIFLSPEGNNQRKVQDGETRVPVDALKVAEMMKAAGEDPQVTLSSADKNGKVNVIVGDKTDPESGEKYQDLVNKKKNILKNDPTNTRVLDEIEKELEKIALRQEAQRAIEERFPDGPPPPPSPEQAQALNQNMAMMQMLQGQGPNMPPDRGQIPLEAQVEPQAVPLAQTGRVESTLPKDIYEDQYGNKFDIKDIATSYNQTSNATSFTVPQSSYNRTGFFSSEEKQAMFKDNPRRMFVDDPDKRKGTQAYEDLSNLSNPDYAKGDKRGLPLHVRLEKGPMAPYNYQVGGLEGIPEYQDGFPEIDYTEGRPAMTPEEAAIIASMYGIPATNLPEVTGSADPLNPPQSLIDEYGDDAYVFWKNMTPEMRASMYGLPATNLPEVTVSTEGTPFNTNFLDDNYYAPRQRVVSTDIDPYADEDLSGMEGIVSRRNRELSGYTTVDGGTTPQSTDSEPLTYFERLKQNQAAAASTEDKSTSKASGTKDKDKDGQPDYLGMGILAGAGLASNIGNIMYLAEQGKRAEYEDPGKYMVDPRLISLDEQRKDIETRMNRVAYENRMRGQGDITREAFLAGQELQQMAPTYEREQNLNAQIINQADQFNAQMRMNADDMNARNRAAALKQYYDSISQIGQNINNLAIDINQRRENQEMYNILGNYFENYTYVKGKGWVFKGTEEDKA